MVHIPSAYTYDFWTKTPTEVVELTCLMPNGVIIPLEANRNITLAEIKEDLWEEASKYPLHGTLKDAPSYVFSCINSNAEAEELRDESRRLCDIKPFCSVLKVIEREGVKGDRNLDSQIGVLIGKGLHEFAALKNSEVNDFRWKMRLLGDDIALQRQKLDWEEKMRYQYPPRLAPTSAIPKNIESRLKDGNMQVLTKFQSTETTYTFQISHDTTPYQLIDLILKKRANTLMSKDEIPSDFTLKVCGQEEYLIGDYPLIQYSYIQNCISRDITPTLITININNVMVDQDNLFENPELDTLKRARPTFSTLTLRKKGKHISAWKIEDWFVFNVNGISRLNCDAANRTVEVGLQAGLFHGGKSLCESQKTKEITVNPDGSCYWEEMLKFDIRVKDIPRNARLCFVLYEISKTAKGLKNRRLVKDSKQDYFINPLCWANTTIYDFKSQFKTGAMTLYTWTYVEDMQNEDLLHPLGTVVSNPHIDRAAALMLTFPNYGKDKSVLYPSPDKVVEYAMKLRETKEDYGTEDINQESEMSKQQLEQLKLLADRDPLHELHEQEKKTIWALRRHCLREIPSLLSKLLQCVEWNDHEEVAEATALVQQWPKLPVERALELLDYAYADQTVRSFAVRCLKDVSDEDLSLFLLQLVQALKHENYLSCDLTEFLLRRALNNQRIGHYLFWHLRSEMQVASVSVRFGLILEAYCRGAQQHMKILFKQMECLDKLKNVSEQVKQRKDRKLALTAFQDYLQEPHCQEALSNILNPLDPSFRWHQIKIEKCRVMDSKMRPLWLVFDNSDPFGDDIYLIMKHGDDLRQDMLTLQMLRIMDKLWKREGLDLRMNPYRCISTDNRVGMIEVVLNAETIANIQKEKGMFSATAAFRRGSLLTWLKDHNTTKAALDKAIEEFTLSCAGYCVATYVLGIADRHSDNIMVKKTGQLFHVDFGHILGHFKEKFGFRRERVPFVLTNDFVHVINKGQTKKGQAVEFQRFQNYCETAFLVLRRHGGLILSLFAMMISTGLPELSSEKDLNYLRDTLVLEMSEAEAQKHFRSKFDEALCNSWKTSLNWASHNMAKNNKTT
ncbi:phosphatidylinositol 4,5-bisphosphate 3-kinase catalytic subunit delta isoform-like [Chelonus insularis]|uniref:phosphatidylinositol 4,5-bisphosphate 3-kinase catalytic subunit delta isoform-like n=1 Tax=Chelonus insularis TaxID=460826 RepID=UPI00158E33AC|nr:phosphatidylinositol 4,5-bisphosphate 3-kinase catalytic subunit delta isoform-like [Chelonus insularis]XP_034944948.1 phosphatidylinositol 4,5-bisphosphate 3-kinase catalytic subunit delta isoform-like [Chelonus insularis]